VLEFPRLGFVSEFLVRFRSPVAITRVVRITVLFIRNPAKAEKHFGGPERGPPIILRFT
jgi:hypothetical protein